jgi:hypothetical protein
MRSGPSGFVRLALGEGGGDPGEFVAVQAEGVDLAVGAVRERAHDLAGRGLDVDALVLRGAVGADPEAERGVQVQRAGGAVVAQVRVERGEDAQEQEQRAEDQVEADAAREEGEDRDGEEQGADDDEEDALNGAVPGGEELRVLLLRYVVSCAGSTGRGKAARLPQ